MGWFDDNHSMGACAQGYESDGDGGYKMEYTAAQMSGAFSGGYGGYGGGRRKRKLSGSKAVTFTVEVAKSNRSRCSLPSCNCGGTISTGDLKLKKETYSDFGKAKQNWHHAEYFFRNKTKDLATLS